MEYCRPMKFERLESTNDDSRNLQRPDQHSEHYAMHRCVGEDDPLSWSKVKLERDGMPLGFLIDVNSTRVSVPLVLFQPSFF